MINRHCFRKPSLRSRWTALVLGLLFCGPAAAQVSDDRREIADKLEAILAIVKKNADDLATLKSQVEGMRGRSEVSTTQSAQPAGANAGQNAAGPDSAGPDLLWRVPGDPGGRRTQTVIERAEVETLHVERGPTTIQESHTETQVVERGPTEIRNQTVERQTIERGPYQVSVENVTQQDIRDSTVDVDVVDVQNQDIHEGPVNVRVLDTTDVDIQQGPVEIGVLQTEHQEVHTGPVEIDRSESNTQVFEGDDLRIQRLESHGNVTIESPVSVEENIEAGPANFYGDVDVKGDLHQDNRRIRNQGEFTVNEAHGPITNHNRGRFRAEIQEGPVNIENRNKVDVDIAAGPVTNTSYGETNIQINAPTTIENAQEVTVNEASKSNGLSTFDVNLGSDDRGELTASARGRFFKTLGGGSAVQAQGELMHYSDRDEGQADLGLVHRWKQIQAGGFASFKYAKTSDWRQAGGLGQAAVTLDYVFERGRFGLFGTKSFLEGDVVDSRSLLDQPNTIVETYLDVVDQFGVSTAVAAWGQSWFEGNAGALFRANSGAKAGGSLRYVHPLASRLALTLETGLNETMVSSSNTGRFVAGLQFGRWLSPHNYGDRTDGQPVPTDVPRIRYEALTRTIRPGNDRPVARAGSDQTVSAGEVTLDGSGSFDPDQDPITFEWTAVAPGPLVELAAADTAHPSFLAEEGETYYFRLTVRDEYDGFDRDDVVVSVEDGELFIRRFVATPSYLPEPGVVTLLWEVVGAERVEIDKITSPLANMGSSTVHVDESDDFTLTAWRGEQSISETVAVTVACPEPVIELFSANPQQVAAGGSTSLSWAVTGGPGTTVEISPGGAVGLTGDLTVSPEQTTVYTITATTPCEGGRQETASRSLTVTVLEPDMPRILNFVASPTKISPGEQSLLSWEVEKADEITIEPSLGGGALTVDAVGTSTVAPSDTVTYTLTAKRGDQWVSAEATVEVYRQVRILSFEANKTTVANPGEPAELSWEVENAEKVVITGVGPMTGKEDRGTVTVHPVGQTIYTLIAYGENTETSALVIIDVENPNHSPIAIVDAPWIVIFPPGTTIGSARLDGTKSYDPDGDPIQFEWRVLGGRKATFSDPTSPVTTIEFLDGPGQYEVELMVTDNKGSMGFDKTEVVFDP